MILRRVIDHVKDQNWTAVVIDFFIVVIGVVIGIEVTNWNDQRKARDDLAASLRNLAQEVSNTLWHRDDQIQWGERKKEGFTLMLEALDGRELSEEEWQAIYAALPVAASPPPWPARYETLHEMQSAGRLKDIPSAELRAALGEMLSFDKKSPPYLDKLGASVTAAPFSPQVVSYELDAGRQRATMRIAAIDLRAARADPQFRLRVMQGHSLHASVVSFNRVCKAVEAKILALLKSEGYEPSGHWLIENRELLETAEKNISDEVTHAEGADNEESAR